VYTAQAGLTILILKPAAAQLTTRLSNVRLSNAALFLLVLAAVSYWLAFQNQQSQLLLFLPILTAALSGVFVGVCWDVGLSPMFALARYIDHVLAMAKRVQTGDDDDDDDDSDDNDRAVDAVDVDAADGVLNINSMPIIIVRTVLTIVALYMAVHRVEQFYYSCYKEARFSLSGDHTGIIHDVYSEAYHWLRDNTPEDSRVLAWSDYGSQITSIANRTTLADGQTLDENHLGLLALVLTSPPAEAHCLARHLADYVLVRPGVDLAKSLHMARVANSVFDGHCYDAECSQYGTHSAGNPSQMKASGLMWHLVGRDGPSGPLDESLFEEVYVSSRQSAVRILRVLQVSQKSKDWAADPANMSPTNEHEGQSHRLQLKICGGGVGRANLYCSGRYPPALRAMLMPVIPSPEELNGLPLLRQSFKLEEVQRYRSIHGQRISASAELAPKWWPAQLPEGSYRSSCRGCNYDEGNRGELQCTHCHRHGSPAGTSYLDVRGQCNGQAVDNIGGQLQCTPPTNQPGIPPGAYTTSCLGCAIKQQEQVGGVDNRTDRSAEVLHCIACRTVSGDRVVTWYELDRCPLPHTLENEDGVLVCNGPANKSPLPEGGFEQSCLGCAVIWNGEAGECDIALMNAA